MIFKLYRDAQISGMKKVWGMIINQYMVGHYTKIPRKKVDTFRILFFWWHATSTLLCFYTPGSAPS